MIEWLRAKGASTASFPAEQITYFALGMYDCVMLSFQDRTSDPLRQQEERWRGFHAMTLERHLQVA